MPFIGCVSAVATEEHCTKFPNVGRPLTVSVDNHVMSQLDSLFCRSSLAQAISKALYKKFDNSEQLMRDICLRHDRQ
jgi:hypothetical protein